MWHKWGKREIHTGYVLGNMTERVHLKDPGVLDRIT